VFSSFSARLADVMQRMEQLVLDSVQLRLVRCLLARADTDSTVRATHEELAFEIGTAREVVSRHLKALEQEGLIRMQRGSIRLERPGALRAIS
jgi:CRP/FNR family transcriptional regulator